jgi:hypothetical protein
MTELMCPYAQEIQEFLKGRNEGGQLRMQPSDSLSISRAYTCGIHIHNKVFPVVLQFLSKPCSFLMSKLRHLN